MTPGIHILSADAYHADPAPAPSLSSSIASILLNQSPLHAWMAHPKLNPKYQREGDSRFDLGSAAHMLLLERRTDNIVVVDANDWRTKAAKELRDAAQAEGKFAILAHKYLEVERMVKAARQFMEATELALMLTDGFPERTVLWQEGDIWCKCRPDMLSMDQDVILDYKTTESAAPDVFSRQISRMDYDLQAEFYLRGLNATVMDGEPEKRAFVFLVQEIHAPYACSLVALSNAYRAIGQAKVKRALGMWSKCMAEDRWPGYRPDVLYAEPKPWDLAIGEELDAVASDSEESES